MSWIDTAWPMISAASAMLAIIHFFIWLRLRDLTASLMFSLAAASIAVIAMLELAMMRAHSPAQYGELVRWAHVPTAIMAVSVLGFVRLQYRAGSRWLAWVAGATRMACLLPNFLLGANLNYSSVGSLQRITVLGDEMTIAGSVVANPWMLMGNANALLIAAFMAHAVYQIARRPPSSERTRGIIVCVAMLFFIFIAGEWAWLVVHGHIRGPLMFSPAFACVLFAMGYEIGDGIVRATRLARNLTVAEHDLRESERRMDYAVHAAGVGLWNWDMQRSRIWLSPQACTLLGMGAGTQPAVGEVMDRLHDADRGRFEDAMRGGSAAVGDFRCEYRTRLDDGKYRWIATRGQIVLDAAGQPLRLDGVLVDITERKESESRFRLVVESAPGALLVVDPRGRVVLANEAASQVFGHPVEQLANLSFDALVPSLRPEVGTLAPSNGGPALRMLGTDAELSGRHRCGDEMPIVAMFNPVPFESELCMLVAITDLSEQRRAEREAATQRDELAHLSRVALLTELSGSLAHELNQPLAAILANAQAATRFLDRGTPDLHEVRDSLIAIVDSDKHAAEVIRRMRALLRKEGANHAVLDLNALVGDVLRLLRSDLLSRQVHVDQQLSVPLPTTRGDGVQLQQVLLNLVMNACDAMASQASPRQVLIRTGLADDGRVEVSVADTGGGIPADDLQRIFSPFFTSKRDGLGLGLAVCATIIQAHSGEIWAENNPDGTGARVRIRLPMQLPRAGPHAGAPRAGHDRNP